MNYLKVAGIEKSSITNGPGFRYVIFLQGCLHSCPGCHNPGTHSLVGGEVITFDKIIEDLRANKFLQGVTFSGGEPFLQAQALAELAREIKWMGLDLWAYTGYTLGQLLAIGDPYTLELLQLIDVLVDGPFLEEQKTLALPFRGSANQKIINLNRGVTF